MSLLERIIDQYQDEEFLSADGFEEAVIGVEENSMRLIYSVQKCLAILRKQGLSREEATEHFSYNVSGAYVGEKTPIWCEDMF